ncbi:MAG: rhomboid family intramembrane serine protease [Verrucomicrobia bacterium]|nr:rhomboid family intramembrane serine protease [Verrucomicrobiota bacterium]
MARARKRTLAEAVETSTWLVAMLFVVKGIELVARVSLAGLGIVPRTERGLIGIVFSPFLHANAAHLLANALPLFILLVLLFWDRHYHPWLTLGLIWGISGLGTWLIGRGGTVHIGASSIIFGLTTYFIAAGFWMKSWRTVLVAVAVFLAFGGIFLGVLPTNGPISWEGHLSGALAGLWAARRNR